jgi:hypothetical protein
MKKFIALFLAISFFLMNCAMYKRGAGIGLEPNQKPGALLVIQKTDGTQVRGELIAVKQTSLLLLERESGADVTVDIEGIKIMMIVKKSTWKRVKKGFLMWGGIGTLVTTAYLAAAFGGLAEIRSLNDAMFYLRVFVTLGGIGALIELVSGTDKTIIFKGKSESEIQEILKKLRKKARVTNFQ